MNRDTHRLLVLNFAMDEDHPILGFGVSWVRALADLVGSVHVVTGSAGRVDLPRNVTVDSIGWLSGERLSNVRKLRGAVHRALARFSPDAVFTHMAAPYAAVMGPELRARRLRHVLWYAHASRSKGLLLAYPWIKAIATSTPESCPISGSKVHVIGQGVDTELFTPVHRSYTSVQRAVHWGRADPSKRIEYMLTAITQSRAATGAPLSLTQIGSPATPDATAAWEVIQASHRGDELLRWIPGVSRDRLPGLAADQDVFVHAFQGSMDKAALEAAALGLPVLSENTSVRRELGAWPSDPDLAAQLISFIAASEQERERFAQFQQQRVLARHSIQALSTKLVDLLYPT